MFTRYFKLNKFILCTWSTLEHSQQIYNRISFDVKPLPNTFWPHAASKRIYCNIFKRAFWKMTEAPKYHFEKQLSFLEMWFSRRFRFLSIYGPAWERSSCSADFTEALYCQLLLILMEMHHLHWSLTVSLSTHLHLHRYRTPLQSDLKMLF